MKKTSIKTLRSIADKYQLVWHPQGGQWVINGVEQHYSLKTERAVLADYLLKWGDHVLTPEEIAAITNA